MRMCARVCACEEVNARAPTQCAAVCCSLFQCRVAVCCQCATHNNTLQHTARVKARRPRAPNAQSRMPSTMHTHTPTHTHTFKHTPTHTHTHTHTLTHANSTHTQSPFSLTIVVIHAAHLAAHLAFPHKRHQESCASYLTRVSSPVRAHAHMCVCVRYSRSLPLPQPPFVPISHVRSSAPPGG